MIKENSLTAYSLFIGPYAKGIRMMQEACNQKTQPSELYCNRTIHFILGAAHLIPIVNTIITIALHCRNNSSNENNNSQPSSLNNRVHIADSKKPADAIFQREKDSKRPSKVVPLGQHQSIDTDLPASASRALEERPRRHEAVENPIKKDTKPLPKKTSPQSSSGNLGKLSPDLQTHLTTFLNLEELRNFAQTNKQMKSRIPSGAKLDAIKKDYYEKSKQSLCLAAKLLYEFEWVERHSKSYPEYTTRLIQIRDDLLKALNDIDRSHINLGILMKDSFDHDGLKRSTLLSAALCNLRFDRSFRLKVVKLLIEKGADVRDKIAEEYPFNIMTGKFENNKTQFHELYYERVCSADLVRGQSQRLYIADEALISLIKEAFAKLGIVPKTGSEILIEHMKKMEREVEAEAAAEEEEMILWRKNWRKKNGNLG